MKNKVLIGLAATLAVVLSACSTPVNTALDGISFEDKVAFNSFLSAGTTSGVVSLHSLKVGGVSDALASKIVTDGNYAAGVVFSSPAKTYRQAQRNFLVPKYVTGKTKVTFDIFASKDTSLDVVFMVSDKWYWKAKQVSLVEGVNKVSINLADFKGTEKNAEGAEVANVSFNPEKQDLRSFVLANWTEVEDETLFVIDNVLFQ